MFDVNTLKGKALADKARELDIPGRSIMTANELRDAIEIRLAEKGGPNEPAEDGTDSPGDVPVTDDDWPTLDDWHTVPNRAERRRYARRMRRLIRKNASRSGGDPTREKGRAAGERGKSAPVMANWQRDLIYGRQSNRPDLTARQERRMRKRANRDLARA